MKWTKNQSIRLSQICLAIFFLALVFVDILAVRLVHWYLRTRRMSSSLQAPFIIILYLCSVLALICIYSLWRLLRNIQRELVFVGENVSLLRHVSWCCAGVFIVCTAAVYFYAAFLFPAVAAGFMALIVRIVKNIISQAIEMKSELDLTI